MSRIQTTLDHLDDGAGHDAVLFLDPLDGAPGPLVLRPLLRKDKTAFLVLLRHHERFDLVAQRHDLAGIDVVADRQLARRDDAFGLVADVEENLVLVDLDDRSLDDVAIVEFDDGAGDGVFEGDAVEIVVDDLARF